MIMVFGRSRKVEDTKIRNSNLMYNVDGRESTSEYISSSNEI